MIFKKIFSHNNKEKEYGLGGKILGIAPGAVRVSKGDGAKVKPSIDSQP